MDSENQKGDGHPEEEALFPFNADSVLDELFPSLGDGVASGNPLARLLTSLGSGEDRRQGTSLFNPFNLSPPRLNEIHALATANLISQTQEAIMQEFDFSEFDFGSAALSQDADSEDLSVHSSADKANYNGNDVTLNSIHTILNENNTGAVKLPVNEVEQTEDIKSLPKFTAAKTDLEGKQKSLNLVSKSINEPDSETFKDRSIPGELEQQIESDLNQAVESIKQNSHGAHSERKSPTSILTILNIPEVQRDSVNMTNETNTDDFVGNLPTKTVFNNQFPTPDIPNNNHIADQVNILQDTHQTSSDKSNDDTVNINIYSNVVSNHNSTKDKQFLNSADIPAYTYTNLSADTGNKDNISGQFQIHNKLTTGSIEIETSIDLAQSENNVVFVCETCLKQFTSAEKLVGHSQNHHKYVCPHPNCVKTCASRSHLQYHLKVHSGERSYKCGECGQQFTKEQHLRTHRQTHRQDKQLFYCTQCGKGFSLEGNLKNHEKLHSGEKPYACDHPGCKKRFAERATLNKHAVTHTGEKKYKCTVCNKGFTQACSRTAHMKCHRDSGQMQEG